MRRQGQRLHAGEFEQLEDLDASALGLVWVLYQHRLEPETPIRSESRRADYGKSANSHPCSGHGATLGTLPQARILEALNDTRIVVVQGARQVGKSTVASEVVTVRGSQQP